MSERAFDLPYSVTYTVGTDWVTDHFPTLDVAGRVAALAQGHPQIDAVELFFNGTPIPIPPYVPVPEDEGTVFFYQYEVPDERTDA